MLSKSRSIFYHVIFHAYCPQNLERVPLTFFGSAGLESPQFVSAWVPPPCE